MLSVRLWRGSEIIEDMPKLESPFVREIINGNYIVTPKTAKGYEWVFEDPEVRAVEKLDGTNVSIIIEGGKITRVFNRTADIPFFNKGKGWIIQGILNSFERGYCDLTDGQYFGELIGPKVGGAMEGKAHGEGNVNPYKLEENLWIPFKTYAWDKLHYKSWGKYPKTFDSISEWFRTGLLSLFMMRREKGETTQMAEGVVFTHPDGRLAKLRRDMFPFYYEKKEE